MREVKDQFIDQTIDFWQQHTSRTITREDARQIIQNVKGFFRVLMEWEEAAEQCDASPDDEDKTIDFSLDFNA